MSPRWKAALQSAAFMGGGCALVCLAFWLLSGLAWWLIIPAAGVGFWLGWTDEYAVLWEDIRK